MRRDHRRILLNGLAQLYGVAAGLDLLERDRLAAEWEKDERRLPGGLVLIRHTGLPEFEETPLERERALVSEARYAMHMAAVALDGYGWRSEPLAARIPARTAPATAAVVAKGDRHRLRASELRAQGLSARQIGLRMANEEQRDAPYGERIVRRWLSGAASPKG